MLRTRLARAGLGLAVGVLVMTAGCSRSLINPHVEWPPVDHGKTEVTAEQLATELGMLQAAGVLDADEFAARKRALAAVRFRNLAHISFPEARQHADNVRGAYKDALGGEAELQSWLGIGLIPLAAASIGLGATGANSNLVLALGLAGASAYGTGQWLINRPRQRAWVTGYNAITCAVTAMEPLHFSLPEQVELRADMVGLSDGMQTTQVAIGAVERAAGDLRRIVDNSNDAQILLAAAQASAANAAVASGREALRNARVLERQIVGAGGELVSAVDDIAGHVQQLVVDSQLDLSALFSIMNGLGSTYSRFTTVPEGIGASGSMARQGLAPQSPADSKETQRRNELNIALAALDAAVARTAAASRRVADTVNAVNLKTPKDKLKRCGVDPAVLITALTTDPAGPFRLTGDKAGSVPFSIVGGQAPFMVDLGSAAPEGLEVEQRPGPFARGVLVSATKDVPAGEYSLSVADGGGRHLAVPLVIGSDQPGKPNPGRGNERSDDNQRGSQAAGGSLKQAFETYAAEAKGQEFEIAGVKLQISDAKSDLGNGDIDITLAFVSGRPTKLVERNEVQVALNRVEPLGLKPENFDIRNWTEIAPRLTPAAGSSALPAASPGALKKYAEAITGDQTFEIADATFIVTSAKDEPAKGVVEVALTVIGTPKRTLTKTEIQGELARLAPEGVQLRPDQFQIADEAALLGKVKVGS